MSDHQFPAVPIGAPPLLPTGQHKRTLEPVAVRSVGHHLFVTGGWARSVRVPPVQSAAKKNPFAHLGGSLLPRMTPSQAQFEKYTTGEKSITQRQKRRPATDSKYSHQNKQASVVISSADLDPAFESTARLDASVLAEDGTENTFSFFQLKGTGPVVPLPDAPWWIRPETFERFKNRLCGEIGEINLAILSAFYLRSASDEEILNALNLIPAVRPANMTVREYVRIYMKASQYDNMRLPNDGYVGASVLGKTKTVAALQKRRIRLVKKINLMLGEEPDEDKPDQPGKRARNHRKLWRSIREGPDRFGRKSPNTE